MVGVAFLCDFVAVGFFFYSYGVFFKALAGEFAGSRLGVSLGLTVNSVVGAMAAPYLGRLLDRVSIRRIMLGGAFATSLGFVLLSRIQTPWQYYLLLGSFVALGLNAMGGMAAAKLVTNWFVARRGAALGIATIGISFSGLVMPAVATWLVAHVGWRGGFLVYGAATLLLVAPVVAFVVVDRPEQVGERPDGGRRDGDAGSSATLPERVWRTREIVVSRNFWAIGLSFSLCFACLSAVLTHLVPHATDLGIGPYRAAGLLSAAAAAGMTAKPVFGWLIDHSEPRLAIGASLAAQLLGVLLLLGGDEPRELLAAALVFGFGMGGVIPLQGAITGIAFGRLSFGKVSGLMRPLMVPISALGVPFAGWVHDRWHDYAPAFQLFVILYAVAAMILVGFRAGDGTQPAFSPRGPVASRAPAPRD